MHAVCIKPVDFQDVNLNLPNNAKIWMIESTGTDMCHSLYNISIYI